VAKETWTVFYGQQRAGTQKPVNGWTEKNMKVAKISNGSTLEKNEPAVSAEPGKAITCIPQECYFVSVIAESAEEACLVVDKFLSQGGANATAGGGGPSIKGPFVNSGGKAFAALSSNLTEVGVL
jgi:hypothetical protein